MRVHLARALALGPRLLIAEHPSATLPRDSVPGFAADLARVARTRGLGLLALTSDDAFARALGGKRLVLHGGSGDLKPVSLLKKLFQCRSRGYRRPGGQELCCISKKFS